MYLARVDRGPLETSPGFEGLAGCEAGPPLRNYVVASPSFTSVSLSEKFASPFCMNDI